MEIGSTNSGGRAWRDNTWLVLVEFVVVVAIYVARQHHILKLSATPYLLLLAWISLRLRGVQWKEIGFTRYRTWATTLLLGVVCGVGLELFDLFGKQPLFTCLLGKPPDLSNFAAVKGNLRFALVIIALLWVLAAFGEAQIPRRFYPLQFLSSRLSTARSICSCFLVKVTIRPSLKPLLGSRRYTRYNPSNSLSAS